MVVVSQVKLNHSILGTEGLRAVQRSREVKKDVAEQLGLSPNLIELVPAVMPSISISLEFILDKENRLATLTGLINDDSFLAAASFAPGALAVAKTVSGLAQKVIQSFVPAEEREPILQFSGDFNLAGNELRDGYYVIFGTRDEKNALPSTTTKLAVVDGELQANGQRVTQLSYVVIEVRRVPARTRDLNDGAAWEQKLREAEGLAQDGSYTLGPEAANGGDVWSKCRDLLRDAQTIIRADLNYHRWEANNIIASSYNYCTSQLAKLQSSRQNVPAERVSVGSPEDRAVFGIANEQALRTILGQYANDVAASRRILRDV
jgi:hypothetical protein